MFVGNLFILKLRYLSDKMTQKHPETFFWEDIKQNARRLNFKHVLDHPCLHYYSGNTSWDKHEKI